MHVAMDSVSTNDDLCKVALRETHDRVAIEVHDALSRGNKYTEATTLAIPTRRHLFVDSGFKEETRIANCANLINRFDVICRFCLDEKEGLLHIFDPNECVMVMTESIVDVKIEADDMLPKQICTHCFELLNQCLAFKQQIVSTDTALRRCIDQRRQVGIVNQKEYGEASDPGITEQHIFDAITTHNVLIDGHKFEDLIEEEYIPGDEIVCKKDSNLYINYDETPVGGAGAFDYSLEVKSEPIMNPSDTIESSPNVRRQSQTSVKCEQCDKEFSCNSILQRHKTSHATEMLKHHCSVSSKSFARQAGLKDHMHLLATPREAAEEQANGFKCAKCNASFAVKRDLYIHGSIHPENGKVRCCQCDKYFPNLTRLRSHLKTHYEEKPIEYGQYGRGFTQISSRLFRAHRKEPRDRKHVRKNCSKAYLSSHALPLHYPRHTGDKQWGCTTCGKRFIDPRCLKRHMRLHANVRKFCCTVCQKSFIYRSALKNHLRLHTRQKQFVCTVCDKSFRIKWNLRRHLRVHSGEKPHKCPHCSKSFADPSTLVRHVRTHTGEKPYKCAHCSKAFNESSALNVHVRTHTGEKPYKCPNCSKSFRTSSALAIHVRSHTSRKPYKCSHCSKSFVSSSTLAVHVRGHTGDRQYKCPNCSKTFDYPSMLDRHVRTHTGEKPHKCPHCSKAFCDPSALAVHVRTHTGEKPYKCPNCSKTFGTSSNLAAHTRTHTGEKPFKCPHCSKTFSQSSNMAVHVRTHTGENRYKCSHCAKA